MIVRFAGIGEILALRDAVIIQGTGRAPGFPGDEDPATRHIGVFDEGACTGCATFMRNRFEERDAWQLRGMASAPERRGEGIGRALLDFAERELPLLGPGVFWCNARASAAPFYEKMGWRVVSDRFMKPGVGPHFRMVKELEQV